MILLGIDPGVKGAIAVFDTDERRVTCRDMPDTTASLRDLIIDLPPIAFAVIEKPFYPKIIGMANAARIAEAYGSIKASLAWRGAALPCARSGLPSGRPR